MSPLLISIAAGLALSVGAYFYGRHDGRLLQEASQALAREVAEEAARTSREEAAEAISKITIRHQTIRQELEKEVRHEKVYSDCVVTPGGMLNINAALSDGQKPSPVELPAPDTSK